MTRAQSVREDAVATWDIDGIECWATPGPAMMRRTPGLPPVGGLNGYCRFPKRPLVEEGYHGIATYVPVHGGITFAEQDDDGSMVYGFDTAHASSDEMPREDPEWIKGQCALMVAGLKKAAEVERRYLRCITNEGKAKHAQAVSDVAPDGTAGGLPFGVLINLIGGEL